MLLKRHHGINWLVAHQVSILRVSPQNARNFFRKCLRPGSESFIDKDDETLFVVDIILVLLPFSNVDSTTRNLGFLREGDHSSVGMELLT